ncbi:hypothetical protein F4775DRAFT_265945 [Biscogniauxia sp. FL1348]|nr:hypothetical protein F4775DRAFT_265945 [Biscogniauxia sp. FL1348]
MSKLPLRVQVGLRDSWKSDDAPVQKARASLKQLVGVDVEVEPDWHLLLTDLDSYYPDKSTFVPSVAACVQAWCESLSAIVDDEANEQWSEVLIERIKGRLKVFVTVSASEEMALSWSEERTGFLLALPRGPIPTYMKMEALFKGALLSCFTEKTTRVVANADDWADISVDKTGKPDVVDAATTWSIKMPNQELDTLPHISLLPRPDDLLLNPPYHLVVYSRGQSSVEIQCSHSPTLQLLSEYLKKWCRTNSQNVQRPPAVEISLHQSSFGLGLVYDRLTMSVESRHAHFSVTPMIVLPLVEGVLGYKSVSADGTCWVFRRDVGFKRSS